MAGCWLRALPPLVALLNDCLRNPVADRLAMTGRALQRFSFLGMAGAGAILLSGVVNASFTVSSVMAVVESRYGGLLLAKVALFAVILVIAAINRTRLTPQRASPGNVGERLVATRQLRRNVLVEMVLGLGIVVIAGRLGITMAGR